MDEGAVGAARRRSHRPRGHALGFGRVSLGAFVILITVQGIFIHANVRMNFGSVRWLIATPQFHHWHHAHEPQAYNTNYAGEFPLVDALFGTLYLPASRWPARYGIDDTEPTGYLRQLAWPLRSRCAGDAGAVHPNLVEHSASAPSGKVF